MSDYIVEDNLALILRWVPVKTLLQVRCVCKGWKEIIDSPLFIREHLSLQKARFLLQKPRFFLEKGSPECSVLDPHALPSVHMLNGPTEDHGYLFIGTHNGVVCLFNYSTRSNLLLWNPSIRMFLTVPIPKYKDSGWKYFEGQDCFGFWIDPSSKEYKFVIVNSILDKKGKPAGSVVYSSIRQDWRVIPAVEVGSWMPRPTVMIHGVAHWRGNSEPLIDAGIILSFDFIHERFDLIEMPDLKLSLDEPIHCHWQGHLAVVVRDRKSSDRCNVYLRQEGLWVNKFGFNLLPQMRNVFWVLGEEERVRVLTSNHYELVLYDSSDGIIRLTDEDSDDRVYSDVYLAYDFVESLLFP